MKTQILALFAVAVSFGAAAQSTKAVEQEIARLNSCPGVFKVSPPPIFARFVWRTPSDVHEIPPDPRKNASNPVIEFAIKYEQSEFYSTAEEAAAATSFQPLLMLRQRITYRIAGNELTPVRREALIGKKWELQKTSTPELSCWQPSLK